MTLNGEHMSPDGARAPSATGSGEELGIPVVLPLEEGVESLLPAVREFLASEAKR